ncbi:unnamed protein product [Adineta ricciae]|uniref:N-alpha-acetyltransferase 60 n=1 Tax=Adineta ricciae TaxID=249248 RepID=A0A815ECQ9_ADIRI|nr:unnamed protein product [Adineta ricciae]
MNVTDNVRRAFRSKYSFDVPSTWLQACLTWLRDQFQLPNLTNNCTLEKVYNQWLHTDIALLADASCLPSDLDLNAKKVQLTGKYALQINSISCISDPYYTQVLDIYGDQNDNERIDTDITETQQWKPPPPKRVLYLELTDGKTLLRGLEYEPITGLDRDTTLPGAKIFVSGPVFFRRGMLLLTSKNTQVLGGYAENLVNTNSSLEIALGSLSKTASHLDESRMRFNRLNVKVHVQINFDDPTTEMSGPTTDRALPHGDEDEMDEFIRQAYADGVINDNSQLTSNPPNYDPPSIDFTNSTTSNQIAPVFDQPNELIYVSDDEETRLSDMHLSASFFHNQSPPCAPVVPPTIKICLPFTYLSAIRQEQLSLIIDHEDFVIKGCFSTIVSNPRVVKNDFELEVLLNDGSECIKVRLAPEFLNERLGMTGSELLARRNSCRTDVEKRQLQTDFNDRLKRFGQEMERVNSTMMIRFFSDDRLPEHIKLLITEDSATNPLDPEQHLKYRMQVSSQSIAVSLNASDGFATEQFHVLLNNNTSISFRFLRPGDQAEVKALCCDWFPIEYPDQWYDDIVHDPKYFSLAAYGTHSQRIIGLVVADILALGDCNREDQAILHRSFSLTTPVCYILILGVGKEYRRQGLAGILLQQLLNMLHKQATCKAIYLHVLHSNKQAIRFYQSKNFQYRIHLPYYYCITGDNQDGYCFALYINGGYPPFTLSDFLSTWWTYLIETSPCRFLNRLGHFVTDRLIFLNNRQRLSSYKQISRII